jgi:hypothetical protein
MIDTLAIWACPACGGVYRAGRPARSHRKYEAEKADPQRAERLHARRRKAQRRYRERHPDRQRQATRAWRARVQADPQRRLAYNADQRMNYRLRAERFVAGARIDGGYKAPGSACDRTLDAAELVDWLERAFAGWEHSAIARACRIHERVVWQLLTAREPLVSLHVADSVLTGYGRPDLLNALYPHDES